jgi:hypothetical protein
LPGLLTTAVVLSAWFGLTLQARDQFEGAAELGVPPQLYVFLAGGLALQLVLSPIIVLLLACLWLFPVLPDLRRRAPTALPDWAYLGPTPQRQLMDSGPIRLSRLVAIALAGALIYLIAIACLRLLMRGIVPAAEVTSDYKLALFAAEVAIAALIQGYVAAATANTDGPVPLAQGMCAAFLSGAVMSAEALVLNLLLGGGLGAVFLWTTFSSTLTVGALLALVFATGQRALTARIGGADR